MRTDSSLLQEVACNVRTINFKMLIRATVRWHQSDVGKHRAGIQEFAVEFQATMLVSQCPEMINAAHRCCATVKAEPRPEHAHWCGLEKRLRIPVLDGFAALIGERFQMLSIGMYSLFGQIARLGYPVLRT